MKQNQVKPSPKKITEKSKEKNNTSWGSVATWYDKHLEHNDDTYHTKVIFPNVLRILGNIKGQSVLDLACGQGKFTRHLKEVGAFATGVDIGKELIEIAEKSNESITKNTGHKIIYYVTSADDLYMIKNNVFDKVVCILALQNIENLSKTVQEVSRVLKKNGSFIFVLNHPAFRNPRVTSWGYDSFHNVQYRRVDEYMSESRLKIDMTPGSKTNKKFTVSFHRPLQVYIKILVKHGFSVIKLEEWLSHKESEKGPRKKAEDISRKEIPLFMCIEAKVL